MLSHKSDIIYLTVLKYYSYNKDYVKVQNANILITTFFYFLRLIMDLPNAICKANYGLLY